MAYETEHHHGVILERSEEFVFRYARSMAKTEILRSLRSLKDDGHCWHSDSGEFVEFSTK